MQIVLSGSLMRSLLRSQYDGDGFSFVLLTTLKNCQNSTEAHLCKNRVLFIWIIHALQCFFFFPGTMIKEIFSLKDVDFMVYGLIRVILERHGADEFFKITTHEVKFSPSSGQSQSHMAFSHCNNNIDLFPSLRGLPIILVTVLLWFVIPVTHKNNGLNKARLSGVRSACYFADSLYNSKQHD